MKYFGEKSLSSVLSTIMHVSWYAVLAGAIITFLIGVINLFSISFGDPFTSEIARSNFNFFEAPNKDSRDWEEFKTMWPVFKFLIMPYFAAIVVLLLQIIKKAQNLFTNFKNDILFNRSNVVLISNISKLIIGFSILTFSFSSLLSSVFLFMLCEIFKNGTALQEEHDYTV